MIRPFKDRSRMWLAIGAVGLAFAVAGSAVAISSNLTPRASAAAPGQIRQYYIAAEEVSWDYISQSTAQPDPVTGLLPNLFSGEAFGAEEDVFVTRGPDRIGSIYRKAKYVEYTDASFTTPKPIPPSDEHLGILGPTLRAEVGDTLKITFKNNTNNIDANGCFPVSMHPHGVFYDKASEGAPYADGSVVAPA